MTGNWEQQQCSGGDGQFSFRYKYKYALFYLTQHFIISCIATCLDQKRLSDILYIIIIIIIIVVWHYNPLWVFAFSAKSLQVLLSLAVSFQFLTFTFFRSSMTSSCHRCLGLPTVLVPIGLQSNSFLVGLAWSIRCICPSHLILCTLMNLTISALSINP